MHRLTRVGPAAAGCEHTISSVSAPTGVSPGAPVPLSMELTCFSSFGCTDEPITISADGIEFFLETPTPFGPVPIGDDHTSFGEESVEIIAQPSGEPFDEPGSTVTVQFRVSDCIETRDVDVFDEEPEEPAFDPNAVEAFSCTRSLDEARLDEAITYTATVRNPNAQAARAAVTWEWLIDGPSGTLPPIMAQDGPKTIPADETASFTATRAPSNPVGDRDDLIPFAIENDLSAPLRARAVNVTEAAALLASLPRPSDRGAMAMAAAGLALGGAGVALTRR